MISFKHTESKLSSNSSLQKLGELGSWFNNYRAYCDGTATILAFGRRSQDVTVSLKLAWSKRRPCLKKLTKTVKETNNWERRHKARSSQLEGSKGGHRDQNS